MARNTLTLKQVDGIINAAAQEGRVYHYNGGQVYIRLSMQDTTLMVIDHTRGDDVEVSISDGSSYFATYPDNNFDYSHRLIVEPSHLALLYV
jgi:hypothetical protein